MVQGMSRAAWDEFSKTVLERYILLYVCGTLFLDSSASLKKIFAFSVGGLFSLSTHALTCLRRRRFRRWRKLRETVLPSNTIMSISFEASRRGTQWPIIKKASEAPGLTKRGSPDWLKEQEENRLKGENIDRPNTKWAFEDHLVDEINIIQDPQAPLHVCSIRFETKKARYKVADEGTYFPSRFNRLWNPRDEHWSLPTPRFSNHKS